MRKPKLSHTCGDFWTLWPAQPGLRSPNEPRQTQTPKLRKTVRPNITIRVIQAHQLRPMANAGSGHRRRSRLSRRSRITSAWWPFIRRRNFQISTSSSLSLSSLLRFYVSIFFFCLVEYIYIHIWRELRKIQRSYRLGI